MGGIELLVLFFVGILGLMAAGHRVVHALGLAGIVGLVFVLEPSQPQVIGRAIWDSLASFVLTALPLFVLMAEILVRGGVARRAYEAIAVLLGPLPGGAAYANVAGSAVFSAVSGSSVANAAALGMVAAPEMSRLGYGHRLTFGSIAAGGTLGILMPPSSALILYGSITGISIGQLFLAGILPALLATALFALVILLWSMVRGADMPGTTIAVSGSRILREVGALLPVLALIALVLGGLYKGVFSPSEAGAAGVGGALLLVAARGALRLSDLWEASRTTVSITSMILMIIAAAALLKYVLAYLQVPAQLSASALELGLSYWTLLLVLGCLYLLLGLFVESVTLIVLTVPVLYPVLSGLGVDGLWLGIFLVVLVEISLVTPPVGLNLFILQRVEAGQSFSDIAVGSLPFVAALIALIVSISVFPEIVTLLPEMARQAR